MKELKHLNKYFKKYWSKLVIGILITMIARIFQLVMPSYVNKSISIVEDYFDGNIAEALAKKTLLTYILIILGAALLSGFFTFLMRQTIINVSRYIEYDLKNEIFDQYQLLSLNFYKKKPPKSLGLEWVQKEIFPRLESSKRNPKDLLKTFTMHAGRRIAKVFPKNAKVLVTGGGVFNDYLLQRMKYHKKIDFIIPDKKLVEFKEALIFAFLGVLKVDNQVNCLSSVTGAKRDHSSGQIFYPKN